MWKAGEPVSLSPTEFTLLRYFVINAGTVLSKPKILDHVWRYDFGGDVNVVESYVSYLRRKIDTGDKRAVTRCAVSATCCGSRAETRTVPDWWVLTRVPLRGLVAAPRAPGAGVGLLASGIAVTSILRAQP